MTKISIRFYNDREVRAVWDEENSKWWFSVLDIVGVFNDRETFMKGIDYSYYYEQEE
jgi:cell filamentation protein